LKIMTSKLNRAVRQALPVLALAFLTVAAARAAQADGSGLERMQAVLAGRPGGTTQAAGSEHATQANADAADAQELARRSIAGRAPNGSEPASLRPEAQAQAAADAPNRAALLARGDAQALARGALLGPRHPLASGS
jgi:hypothetical protein